MNDKTKSDKDINTIQQHKGIPVNPEKFGEIKIWKRFLDWLVPSISNEDFYIKNLKSISKKGEEKKLIKEEYAAKRVIELATKIEKNKLAKADFSKPKSKLELSKEINRLKEKIKLLEINYGSIIDIHTEFKDGIFSQNNIEDEILEEQGSDDIDEHMIHMRKLLATSLEYLDLSVRAYNSLKAAKINSLGELVHYDAHELLKFRNFGKKTLVELEELLQEKGLTFGMDLAKYKLDEEYPG